MHASPPCKMKDRIFQIMKQEHLNQKEFSATTGISPATLSSIFNGRTSPTLNHAELLHKRFPRLNMSWLMFGEGDMFLPTDEQHASQHEGTAQDAGASYSAGQSEGDSSLPSGDGSPTFNFPSAGGDSKIPVIREVVKYVDKPQRRITEIRIFFDDGTFETFPGR